MLAVAYASHSKVERPWKRIQRTTSEGKRLSVTIRLELPHEGWAEPRRQVLVSTFLQAKLSP